MDKGLRQRQIETLQTEERMQPLYQIMAHTLETLQNCNRWNNPTWQAHWSLLIDMCVGLLPHGGGFDDYPKMDRKRSKPDYFVFRGSYHVMNGRGLYVGWRDYRVTVKPSFAYGLTVRVTGARLGELNEYIYEVFANALRTEYDVNKLRVAILMRDDVVDAA